MKQVTVLSLPANALPGAEAQSHLFDEACADIENFSGVNYLIVRRDTPGDVHKREIVAVFTNFHYFRLDDTEGSPALQASKAQIDYLHNVIGEANKEVVERDKTIAEQKRTIDLLSERIKNLAKQGAPMEAPRKPLESLPVAMPPLAEPAPWPKHPEPTDSGETVMVADMPDEAYAEELTPPQPPLKEDYTCRDSSTKKQHPRAKL